MPNDTSFGLKVLHEEFYTDNISTAAADGICWIVSSDAGDTAFRQLASADGVVCRGATAATDDNLIEFAHALIGWNALVGRMGVEIRLQFDVVTTLAFNFGFNDDQLEDSNTLPEEYSGTAWTSNTDNYIGFVFDVDDTTAGLRSVWEDDTTAPVDGTNAATSTAFNHTFVPTADRYFTMKVELFDTGDGNQARAEFTVTDDVTGRSFRREATATMDRDVLLVPYLGVENRAAAAHVCNIDYIRVWQSRAS